MTHHETAGSANAGRSALDELLDVERQIADRNAELAAECAALLATAHDDAARISREIDAAVARELVKLRQTALRKSAAAVAEIEAEAARAISRYEQLSEAEIDEVAEFAASRVTGLASLAADGRPP